MPARERVAIVGLAVRLPGAGSSLEQFWSNLSAGTDCSSLVPKDRWLLPLESCVKPGGPYPDSVPHARGYFLEPFRIKPNLWNVPQELLEQLDPLYHLALDVGWRAWLSAKTNPIDPRKAGVILGNICLPTDKSNEIAREYLGKKVCDALGRPFKSTLPHPLNRFVAGLPAGLLAKAIGLGGCTFTLDAACASSLYAVKLACDELLSGRADLMLAGGMNRADSQYTQMGFAQLRALSQSGRCAPFDQNADGLMVGEGAGIFALKRLADAERDGDQIHAVIAGCGLSNDTNANLLAPAVEGQLRAMHAAYKQAGLSPNQVNYIECHATGTPVGDAIEFESLKKLWVETEFKPGACVLGAIKSSVGHLLTGAGAAALAKVLVTLRYGKLPPQANFEQPGQSISLAESPFRILQEQEAWQPGDRPRRAAVSGFGFGGVNAHLVLEEYQPSSTNVTVDTPVQKHDNEPLAIVGMAAHYGAAPSHEAFVQLALGGEVQTPPTSKLNGWSLAENDSPKGYPLEELRVPLDQFRIPPRELESMLPQQLLALLVTSQALQGTQDKQPIDQKTNLNTGVFVGLGIDPNTTNYHLRWWAKSLLTTNNATTDEFLNQVSPSLDADRTMGALGSIAASRIARVFGFGGPSFTVCNEEASSGRALELALRALRNGEINRAVVASVELAADPRTVLPSGTDTPGEGASAVVLKRLSDAERDGDDIHGIILGVGSAIGGSVNRAHADPSVFASSLVRACADAGIEPESIGLLETATSPCAFTEAEALTALLTARLRSYPLSLTCVKDRVGSVGASMSLAGLIKATAALTEKLLPPSVQSTLPDRHKADSSTARYWLTNHDDGPRTAAVATAGSDGSVCHIILREYVTSQQSDPALHSRPLGAYSEAVFALECDSISELSEKLDELELFVNTNSGRHIESVAGHWLERAPFQAAKQRALTIVARSTTELLDQLRYVRQRLFQSSDAEVTLESQSGLPNSFRDRIFYASEPLGNDAKVAFVFPGSGNQFAGMGRELSNRWQSVLHRQQSENRLLRSQYSPDMFWTDNLPTYATPKEFLFGQVTLGTLVCDTLSTLGLKPDAMIGLSLGESAGLFGTRVWLDRDTMWQRVTESTLFGSDLGFPYHAARKAWDWPDHRRLDWLTGVIAASAESVQHASEQDKKAYLLIATTHQESVIGGLRSDVEALVNRIGAPFIPLQGVTLAHCEAGKPVEQPYRELHTLPASPRHDLTVYSGAWGHSYEPTSENAANSITAGLIGPINLPNVINAAYHDGVRVFIEVGPGNSCTRMVRSILGDRPHLSRHLTAPKTDSVSLIYRLYAELISHRKSLDLSSLVPRVASEIVNDNAQPKQNILSVAVGSHPVKLKPIRLPRRPLANPETEVVFVEAGKSEPDPAQKQTDVISQPSFRLKRLKPSESAPEQINNIQHNDVPASISSAITATAEAHNQFLQLQASFTRSIAHALKVYEQASAISTDIKTATPKHSNSPASTNGKHSTELPRALSYQQCIEFARGKIGDVLGELYADIDGHPTRVRLPDGPLMLVDEILSIEGEPKSLAHGRVVTTHHVHAQRWYLDSRRIPTSIAVESGQADLFLSAYLGIDFQTKGLAVYRLIDAVVTFHRALPKVNETIVYDIHIDEFIRQQDTWLFRFRFEATVNGQPLMSMTNGVAGFFTHEALASGQGIIRTKLDREQRSGTRPADWRDLAPPTLTSLDTAQVNALREGRLSDAFGSSFNTLPLANPMKLPGGMLRLIDRVPVLDTSGGHFGLGTIKAEYDIQPDDWFLTCHFVDDQVMPGTLMYECCLHTLRVLLMRIGWIGEADQVVCEPVPGIQSRLKCRGQVISTTKVVAYEVNIKEVGYAPEPFCIADALMYADGKPIVEITNMSLRMSGLNREDVESLWGTDSSNILRVDSPYHDKQKIMAYSNGLPSEAFGEPYRPFDHDRVLARLPGPPYQFVDSIVSVQGAPFELKAGASCVAEYEVPSDAWYFEANRCQLMPFSVLLEIALQPCGWLAAYCGSALTSDEDLSFRNLGGRAKQYAQVTPEIGRLTTVVTMTKVSQSGGMVIQHYDMKVSSAEGLVYEGTTYFGFFTKSALANQVGMPQAKVPYISEDEHSHSEPVILPQQQPFPSEMLRMVDLIDGYIPNGGKAGLGLIQGRIKVDPNFWFFKAHFYQDPVWPGSLGLESFLQLLKFVAFKKWADPENGGWQTVDLNIEHEWTYRGQVLPTDGKVVVVLEVTNVDDAAKRLTADGFLTVDGRVIYQMKGFTLKSL